MTSKCPLCQQDNHCNADNIEKCWCQQQAVIPESLLEQVKKQNGDPSCICQSCIEQAEATLTNKRKT